MTWLIFGAEGQLGQSLKKELESSNVQFYSFSRREINIEDSEAVVEIVRKYRPQVVVNCAAWTNVELAEKNFDEVISINGNSVIGLANASKLIGAVFVQISTDYVFDGFKNYPFETSDMTNPVNVYGYSKELGEINTLNNYPDGSYIFRTAWLYSEFGNNFVKKIANNAVLGVKSVVVDDQHGQPTSANQLAKRIVESINKKIPFGIYHATNSGRTTWFGFAKQIYSNLNQATNLVIPTQTTTNNSTVIRPEFTVLSHRCWSNIGFGPMADWTQALALDLPAIVSKIRSEV